MQNYTELIKIKKVGGFSKTKLGQRLFDNQDKTWTDVKLMKRIRAMDKTGESINTYDLLSHYIHMSGSGSTVELLDNMIEPEISTIVDSYIIHAIGTLNAFGAFSSLEIEALRRITAIADKMSVSLAAD